MKRIAALVSAARHGGCFAGYGGGWARLRPAVRRDAIRQSRCAQKCEKSQSDCAGRDTCPIQNMLVARRSCDVGGLNCSRTRLGRAVLENVRVSEEIQEDLRVPNRISPGRRRAPEQLGERAAVTGPLRSRQKPNPVTIRQAIALSLHGKAASWITAVIHGTAGLCRIGACSA
jgi:hypothetical protein